MRAMVLEAPGRPLVERELPRPEPGPGQVLVAVRACGVGPALGPPPLRRSGRERELLLDEPLR